MAGENPTEWRDRRTMHDDLLTEMSEVVNGWF
jgi:hypothetical protein